MDIKEKVVNAYEQLAESYNEKIDHKPHNAYYDRPNTLSLIPQILGKNILDIACGPGKYAEEILAKGANVTGFDISPKMVELAKKRNNGQGEFYVHDMSLPFDQLLDDTFDVVICPLALHYIKEWSSTIREIHRVLKADGHLIISIEHPFFEYNYYQSNQYFDTEPVQCTWNGFGKPVEINSYRRPLSACIKPLTANGFYIDEIIEPLPLPEFEKLDPKHFKELNEFPAFMCIRAVPKSK